MSIEHWSGLGDPDAVSNYGVLRRELHEAFVRPDPASLAYDGITWIVRAGIVRNPRDPDLHGVHLVLRRGLIVPDLYQARLVVPGLNHDPTFEYTDSGGFYLKNGAPTTPVAPGQYAVMHDMLSHTKYDADMTQLSAAAIVEGWRGANPDEPLPDEFRGLTPL